jgi:hypothetical protein
MNITAPQHQVAMRSSFDPIFVLPVRSMVYLDRAAQSTVLTTVSCAARLLRGITITGWVGWVMMRNNRQRLLFDIAGVGATLA